MKASLLVYVPSKSRDNRRWCVIQAFVRSTVNARVILRRNNFDPLLMFSPRVTTYKVLRSVRSAIRAPEQCAPRRRPARLHLDTLWWRAGAETSEREVYRRAPSARSSRLPSLPQASRSDAPVAPSVASTRSLQVPTEQGLSTPGDRGLLLPNASTGAPG